MSVKTSNKCCRQKVPLEINGEPAIPFKGVGKHRPAGRKYAPPISNMF